MAWPIYFLTGCSTPTPSHLLCYLHCVLQAPTLFQLLPLLRSYLLLQSSSFQLSCFKSDRIQIIPGKTKGCPQPQTKSLIRKTTRSFVSFLESRPSSLQIWRLQAILPSTPPSWRGFTSTTSPSSALYSAQREGSFAEATSSLHNWALDLIGV